VVPFIADRSEQHPDIEAFEHALEQGMRSTQDKNVVATFTGKFVVKPNPHLPGRSLFVLYIERIDDLRVTPIDLNPHVPR